MARLDRLARHTRRALSTRPAFGILCTAYALVIVIIMMPALVATVGADDMYFILYSIDVANGSIVNAITVHLGDIFMPDTSNEQPRTVPLAIAARRVLSVIVLSAAVTFSIPLATTWFVTKVILLLVTLASVAALLGQIRFRGKDGERRGIRRSTIVFIMLVLPLGIALGVKAQVVGGLNAWIHYPVLTYGTVPVIFGTTALALWLLRKLEGNYRVWLWPAIVMLALVAFVLNFSYEFVAVAIPVAVLAILLHPRPARGFRWSAWKPAVTVGGALGGVFTVVFIVNRWRLSTWDCVQDGSCYGGSFLDFNALTLWFNFVGALPSSVTPTIETVMAETGRSLPPTFTGWGALTGVLAVMLLAATWSAWKAKPRNRRESAEWPLVRSGGASESRGLVTVIAIAALTAIGVSLVSGLTSRAIALVQTPEMPYRSGVAVWTCIALIAVVVVRMLSERSEASRRLVIGSASVLVVVALAHLLPLNLAVAQAERAIPRAQAVDAIHWDVVLGDLSPDAEAQRCAHAAQYTSVVGDSPYFNRTITGANRAFTHLYGVPYCAETVGNPAGATAE